MIENRQTFTELQSAVQRERKSELQGFSELQERSGLDKLEVLSVMNRLRLDIANCVLDEFLNFAYQAGIDRSSIMKIMSSGSTAEQSSLPADFDVAAFKDHLKAKVDRLLLEAGVTQSNQVDQRVDGGSICGLGQDQNGVNHD